MVKLLKYPLDSNFSMRFEWEEYISELFKEMKVNFNYIWLIYSPQRDAINLCIQIGNKIELHFLKKILMDRTITNKIYKVVKEEYDTRRQFSSKDI